MKRERPTHRFGNATHEIPDDNYASVVKRLRLKASTSHLASSKPHSSSNYGDASPSGCGSPLGHSTSLSFFEFYSMYATSALEEASVSPTESVLLAAEMASDFFSEASMLYDMLSEVKGSHPDVLAMDELMKRMNSTLQDETRFPRAGLDTTSVQMCSVGNVYKGLVRAYVFLYQRFHRAFVALEVEELLAACWQRLLGFSAEHRVLEEDFIQKIYEYVLQLTRKAC